MKQIRHFSFIFKINIFRIKIKDLRRFEKARIFNNKPFKNIKNDNDSNANSNLANAINTTAKRLESKLPKLINENRVANFKMGNIILEGSQIKYRPKTVIANTINLERFKGNENH